MPLPEATRERILQLHEQGRSWRQISRELKVGQGTVSEALRKAGRSGPKPPTPTAPASAPGTPPQEGDGLTEYLPPPTAPSAPKAPPTETKKQTATPAPTAAPSAAPAAVESAPEAERYECGACHAQWELEAGEHQVEACPSCGVSLHG